jgi:hypothetical protein
MVNQGSHGSGRFGPGRGRRRLRTRVADGIDSLRRATSFRTFARHPKRSVVGTFLLTVVVYGLMLSVGWGVLRVWADHPRRLANVIDPLVRTSPGTWWAFAFCAVVSMAWFEVARGIAARAFGLRSRGPLFSPWSGARTEVEYPSGISAVKYWLVQITGAMAECVLALWALVWHLLTHGRLLDALALFGFVHVFLNIQPFSANGARAKRAWLPNRGDGLIDPFVTPGKKTMMSLVQAGLVVVVAIGVVWCLASL